MAIEYRRVGGKLSRNRQRATQPPQDLRRPHQQKQPQVLRDPWRQRFPRQVKPQGNEQPEQVKEDV